MAAPISGRKGRLYVNITSGGTAEPIANLTRWTLNQATDRYEVTAFGDGNKTYAAGLPDAQGEFAGFYDSASQQVYTAATDGVARKVYLYPNTDDNTKYWWGTALFDASTETPVDGPITISGSFAATSTFVKVG